MSARQYEIILFGATGYTGKLIAEQITTSLPTDLKWALAGRSTSKLKILAGELGNLNHDRVQPAIEICNLNDEELSALAKKTQLIIAAVGPYGLHGEYAFKACAEYGTHYLDVTGEIPFVADMIKKYEKTAKYTGSIMIPEIGLDSAPPDLVAWSLSTAIKKRFSVGTAEVVASLHDIKTNFSGGTLETVLSYMDMYSLKQIKDSLTPYAISPIPGPKTVDTRSWTTKLLGIRSVRDLGPLTSVITAATDTAIVHRSWGLLGYGPNFRYHEYARTRNYLTGILTHFAMILGGIVLAVPFLRNTVKKFVYQPGDGPTKEQSKNEMFEYRGIGTPDLPGKDPARAFCKLSYQGSVYRFTAVSVTEAAISILRDDHGLPGGVYTPATLGQKFIDRLKTGGVRVENGFYED